MGESVSGVELFLTQEHGNGPEDCGEEAPAQVSAWRPLPAGLGPSTSPAGPRGPPSIPPVWKCSLETAGLPEPQECPRCRLYCGPGAERAFRRRPSGLSLAAGVGHPATRGFPSRAGEGGRDPVPRARPVGGRLGEQHPLRLERQEPAARDSAGRGRRIATAPGQRREGPAEPRWGPPWGPCPGWPWPSGCAPRSAGRSAGSPENFQKGRCTGLSLKELLFLGKKVGRGVLGQWGLNDRGWGPTFV